LRDRVSEREKLRITADYFFATGELDKEAQTYELWKANYPRDSVPHSNLGANYVALGQYEKALAESQEALRLEPDDITSYGNLSGIYLSLQRLGEAESVINQALTRKLDGGVLRWWMYNLAFLRGNSTQMKQQLAWGMGKPGDEDPLLSMQSDTEAYYGRLTSARDYSRRAVDSAVRAGSKEAGALWQVNSAVREAEFGDVSEAKRRATSALVLASGRDVKVLAALVFARVGDATRGKGLAEDLEKHYSSNTTLKLYWLPCINAASELNKGNSSQSLAFLEAAAPYELGSPPPYEVVGTLYPAYLRGQAYLLAHNGKAAIAEFQKLLDHGGIVVNSVTGALAHLQLGRAYTMAGDTAKAKAAYQDFFALWKDADPDIPILKEAKAEYEKLR
jgi:eukaryotic-like serine/threonine-protein kinase